VKRGEGAERSEAGRPPQKRSAMSVSEPDRIQSARLSIVVAFDPSVARLSAK